MINEPKIVEIKEIIEETIDEGGDDNVKEETDNNQGDNNITNE